MYSRNDPRLRRTLNQISQNIEQANESAQVGLFSVHEHYLKPCFASFTGCLDQCTGAVIPRQDDRLRRARARLPPEYSFDFYDDWEEDENAALLGADDDGIEPEPASQPRKRAFMNYGSASTPPAPRRSVGSAPDPTVIPGPSYFGMFSGLPFIAGKRALRYQPSAENLRPQAKSIKTPNERMIIDDEEYYQNTPGTGKGRRNRNRSGTVTSEHTEDSMSSRGDIFPSDEEDAVPLDDEFDMSFDGKGDESSSGKTKSRRRSHASRKSSYSSKRLSQSSRTNSSAEMSMSPRSIQDIDQIPDLAELRREEQEAQIKEEQEIERRRSAAQGLARQRGLNTDTVGRRQSSDSKESKSSAASASASPEAGQQNSATSSEQPVRISQQANKDRKEADDQGD